MNRATFIIFKASCIVCLCFGVIPRTVWHGVYELVEFAVLVYDFTYILINHLSRLFVSSLFVFIKYYISALLLNE